MHKLLSLFVLLNLAFLFCNAQTPQAIPYQAVVRDSIGNVMATRPVQLRFTIHDGSFDGAVVYSETHQTISNMQGLVNVQIGLGTAVTGTLSAVNWGAGSKFLQAEMKINNSNAYVNLGTQQLMSVPYALYAKNSNIADSAKNGIPNGSNIGEMLYWNGSQWVKVAPGSQGQKLNFCDGKPHWGECPPSYVAGVTDIDGNAYDAVRICNQTWTNKNLNVSKYRNGDIIPQVTDPTQWANLTTGAWCWYDNVSTYGAVYGKLYNWYAVNDPRGLAPNGWHVPSDGEWNTMTKYLDASVDTTCDCWSGSTIGTQLKNSIGWNYSGNGTNSSGFSGLPGGRRDPGSDFDFANVGTDGFWWSSSENGATNAWGRTLYCNFAAVNRLSDTKPDGFSVRLVKDAIQTTASITTSNISNISATSAICGGIITGDGGSNISARGVCWSTSPNPTISLTTKTNDGTGPGTFTSSITGLSSLTTYYVRAYATNSIGTVYGEQQIFTTANVVNIPSVTIGTQVWSTKNLDVVTYRNGDPIPQVTDPTAWANLTTGAWCWYNNDSTNGAVYGKLYNWYAVNDPRGLAPQGWHVPTDAEWNIMTKYLDVSVDTTCQCWSGSTIGTQLKNSTGWNNSGNGSNSSGFAGLPGGYRNYSGGFDYVGDLGFWWSSSENNTTGAWYRILNYLNVNVFRYNLNEANGFSVRLVRD